jgi:hypothetical protein
MRKTLACCLLFALLSGCAQPEKAVGESTRTLTFQGVDYNVRVVTTRITYASFDNDPVTDVTVVWYVSDHLNGGAEYQCANASEASCIQALVRNRRDPPPTDTGEGGSNRGGGESPGYGG